MCAPCRRQGLAALVSLPCTWQTYDREAVRCSRHSLKDSHAPQQRSASEYARYGVQDDYSSWTRFTSACGHDDDEGVLLISQMGHPITSSRFDMTTTMLLQPCLMVSKAARNMMQRARQRATLSVTSDDISHIVKSAVAMYSGDPATRNCLCFQT